MPQTLLGDPRPLPGLTCSRSHDGRTVPCGLQQLMKNNSLVIVMEGMQNRNYGASVEGLPV